MSKIMVLALALLWPFCVGLRAFAAGSEPPDLNALLEGREAPSGATVRLLPKTRLLPSELKKATALAEEILRTQPGKETPMRMVGLVHGHIFAVLLDKGQMLGMALASGTLGQDKHPIVITLSGAIVMGPGDDIAAPQYQDKLKSELKFWLGASEGSSLAELD